MENINAPVTKPAGAESVLNAGLGVAVPPAPTFPAVLDACCGGRMFWWNKTNSEALFMDCREVEKGAFQNGWNPGWCVKPDEIADFRDMPFPDGTFKMVVFDPPHLTSGSMKSVINKKYGLLNKETWKADIVAGFSECWRVLAPGGVLIFKWNEANIKAKDLLRSFPAEPLFGDFTGKTGSTIWVTYMKTPNSAISGKSKGLPVGIKDER
jgi:SAM-dependent methyltransferase